MNTARKECIWFDYCGDKCYGQCDDYWSKEYEDQESEKYYRQDLKRRAEAYKEIVRDYSDGKDDFV